eukprot:1194819-Prorocentrum_minimum.AAC.7
MHFGFRMYVCVVCSTAKHRHTRRPVNITTPHKRNTPKDGKTKEKTTDTTAQGHYRLPASDRSVVRTHPRFMRPISPVLAT